MKIWRNIFLMLAAFSLTSCSSESKVGDWDPMVWKAEVPVQTTDKVYNVSEDGETIIFSCLNYSKPWFSEAEVDGEPILPPYMDEIGYGLIYGENFRAEIHGNKLSIEFKPNKTAQTTNTSITVTAGDIFYTFRFKQFASTVWQYTCQVKYSLYSVSDDLLRFYDITAEYLGIDGKQHTEVITDKSWSYIPEPVGFADIPEDFKCKIVAVRKSELPELTADYYEIGYGVDVHVNFLNADGKVVSKIKHTLPDSFTFETDKTGMQHFLESTPKIEITDYSQKFDKADLIEKLK
jgi:hypothetical protein